MRPRIPFALLVLGAVLARHRGGPRPRAAHFARGLALVLVAAIAAGCAAPLEDEVPDPPHASPYVHFLDRPVKALSPEEVMGLERGEGMQLALPAELNGWPGPKHVLELADGLGLTDAQTAEVRLVQARVDVEARRLGREVLLAHLALEDAFRDRTVDEATLVSLVHRLDGTYADLRVVHLRAHLETTRILTPHQVALYDELRGYGDADHSAHAH